MSEKFELNSDLFNTLTIQQMYHRLVNRGYVKNWRVTGKRLYIGKCEWTVSYDSGGKDQIYRDSYNCIVNSSTRTIEFSLLSKRNGNRLFDSSYHKWHPVYFANIDNEGNVLVKSILGKFMQHKLTVSSDFMNELS